MVVPLVVTLFVGGTVLGTASSATAAPAYPRADGRCVDSTGVLGPQICAKVTKILLRDEARTSDEIAVAVVADTGDASIEQWSTGLFNAWGVGKHDKDNGVLLVVAVDDRRLRLETGRGMAKRLDDTEAADIIDTVITPRFAEDEYAAGILGGLDEVRRRLGHPVGENARLLALAATAPDVEAVPETVPEDADVPGGSDEWTFDGDGDVVPGADYQDGPMDSGGGVPVGGFVFLFFAAVVGLALAGVVRGRGGSQRWDSSGAGSASDFDHRGTRIAGIGMASSHSSHSSSSTSTSSDSSSGAGFGGGGSDGGGSSGSW
jgi:uncharacterized protein